MKQLLGLLLAVSPICKPSMIPIWFCGFGGSGVRVYIGVIVMNSTCNSILITCFIAL